MWLGTLSELLAMSVAEGEILWASKFGKNEISNDPELVYQEVYNLVNGITGIICVPIVFTLLGVVVCMCIQGI